MKKLLYDMLHDFRDILIEQIQKEQDKDKLSELKSDRMVIETTIQRLYDNRYKIKELDNE